MPAIQDEVVEMVSLGSLADKTVFLRVSFGKLGNSKKVKEDILDTEADESMLKVTRMLLDSKELTAIGSVAGQVNAYLNNACNLSKSLGVRVVPLGRINKVIARLKEFKVEWDNTVDAFVAAYPELVKQAEKRLGALSHPEDYPPADEVKKRFYFYWRIVSFGVPGTLKTVAPEVYEEQAKQAEQMMVEAAEEYRQNRRKILLDLIAKLKDKITPAEDGKLKQFRKNTVENIKVFLDEFGETDVMQDSELGELVAQVKGVINPVNAEMLRDNDTFREAVKAELDGISTSLSDMVEDKPARKFREE